MPERKSATLNIQAGTSLSVAPTLLSSDELVRAISSRIQNAVAGHIRVLGAVNLDLVDSATGKVVKSVSSLSDEESVSSLSDEVLSDPALPADALRFFQTPLGSALLATLLGAILNFLGLLYQQHSAEVSQRETEQFVKQMAQSVEQLFLSYSEQAPSAPTPPPTPPQGD